MRSTSSTISSSYKMCAALNTDEIQCIGKRSTEQLGLHFLGVFPADKAPTTTDKTPFAYVVNTDPSDQPGSHWVAVYKASPKSTLEFFDSFGQPLSAYPTLTHLIPAAGYEFNTCSYQSLSSRVCGFYSLAYIYLRTTRMSHANIHRTLSTALPNSDSFVVTFIHKLRDLYRIIAPCTRSCICQSCKYRCQLC